MPMRRLQLVRGRRHGLNLRPCPTIITTTTITTTIDPMAGAGEGAGDHPDAERADRSGGDRRHRRDLRDEGRAAQRRQVVAKAWSDPDFADWLKRDATAAIAWLGYSGRQGEHMRAVFNTPETHNLVVCTLCSCYPWSVLGLPPVWYKAPPYRSRAVIDPRGVLAEFGLTLPADTKIRVWDSTAELRYLVSAERPGRHRRPGRGSTCRPGHPRFDDRHRAARGRSRRMNGPHDLGGQMGFGPVAPEKDEPYFHAEWEKRALGLTHRGRRYGPLEHRREPACARKPASGRLSIVELLRDLDQGARGAARASRLCQRATNWRRAAQLDAGAAAEARPERPDVAGGAGQGRPLRPAGGDAGAVHGRATVRTKNFNPTGHTRLPRYARGKTGIVEAVRKGVRLPGQQRAWQGRKPAMGLHGRLRRRPRSGARAPIRR